MTSSSFPFSLAVARVRRVWRCQAVFGGLAHDSIVFCEEITTVDRDFLGQGPLGSRVATQVMDAGGQGGPSRDRRGRSGVVMGRAPLDETPSSSR